MNGVKILAIVLVVIFGLTMWTVYSVELLGKDFEEEMRLRQLPLYSGKISIHPGLVKHLKNAYVIFVDDMEGGSSWCTYGDGVVEVRRLPAFSGSYSLSLKPSGGNWSFIEALKLFAPPKHKVMGFAFWWTCYGGNFGYLDFGIEFRNALKGYRKAGEIFFYGANIPYYKNKDGELVEFGPESGLPSAFDISYQGRDVSWHFTAIIVDFEKDEYVTLIVDDVEVDMRGIEIYDRVPTEGQAQYNMMEVFVIVSSSGGEQATECLVDDVIVFSLPEKETLT